MADIHDDTTVDCFHNEGFQLSGSIDDRFPAPSIGKAVSEKIAWIQFLQKETFDRQCRLSPSKIDHDRNICPLSCFNRSFDRGPIRSFVVSQLNAYYVFAKLVRFHRGQPSIHIVKILLFRISCHSSAHDIEKSFNSGLRGIDGLLFK